MQPSKATYAENPLNRVLPPKLQGTDQGKESVYLDSETLLCFVRRPSPYTQRPSRPRLRWYPVPTMHLRVRQDARKTHLTGSVPRPSTGAAVTEGEVVGTRQAGRAS